MTTVFAALIAASLTTLPHVRPTHPALTAAIHAGIERSQSFRALVDRINDSDVVVHVMYDDRQAPGVGAHVAFAVAAGGVRYVRIAVSPRLIGCDLLAILGHELRHVVEIAEQATVVDQRSLATFYAAIGERRRGERGAMFDTAAAVAAGDRIRRELSGQGRVDGPDRRP